MKEKLRTLMEREGLKPGQLADMLGINPAGISHILAGRNKPGFDLLQKILRRFPQIDPDWLLLDGQKMYRNGYAPEHSSAPTEPAARPLGATPSDDAWATSGTSRYGGELFDPQPMGERTDDARPEQAGEAANGADGIDAAGNAAKEWRTRANGKSIARIVVFYADGTFEHYAPTIR